MLSVIIPVYNAEKYIRKCLESLLAQTLKDIEIIVVDDKGPDRSMDVVRQIKETHPRGHAITLLEMEHNSGAAAARNYGLQNALGDYVAFVDSDDWCEPVMYESLYSRAEADDCDWCYANAIKEYPDGRAVELKQPHVRSGELMPKIRKEMLSHFVAYFWTSIYKKDFLIKNKIKFPPYRFSEDSFLVWQVVMHAQRFAVVDKPFYHYIVQPNSVSNIYDGTKHQQKIDVFTLLINNLRDEQLYVPYKTELDYLYIKKGFFIPLSICAINTGNHLSKQLNPIFQSVKKLIPEYTRNPYYTKNLPLRFMVALAKHWPCLFKMAMKLYSKNRKEMF